MTMVLVPVPIPTSVLRKWASNLTGLVRLVGQLAEESVKIRLDNAQAHRQDRERVRRDIASAEALIPLLNALRFDKGGIIDTAKALLSQPSAKVYTNFRKQVEGSSALLVKVKATIAASAGLESRIGTEMSLVRQIATQKGGLFDTIFAGFDMQAYAHSEKPLPKEEWEPFVAQLDALVREVNGLIDDAVRHLRQFIETERKAL